MKGSGGTPGGVGMYLAGFAMAIGALWFFFDSVQVHGANFGVLSGWIHGRGGWGGDTTSMGILFVPFLISVIALFYDSKQNWAWLLFWIGLAIVAIEILSRLRFNFQMKSSLLLLMIGLFGAGVGLMLRSYKSLPPDPAPPVSKTPPPDQTAPKA